MVSRHTSPDRLNVLGVVVASLFLALFARLAYLQVIDGAEFASAAQANRARSVPEAAPRGRILDRHGEVLVGNRERAVVTVDRAAAAADKTLLPRLAAFLQQPEEVLLRRLTDGRATRYRPVVVANDLDDALIASLRERESEFVGAAVSTRVERWYPHGTLAAHVLGYVGEISESELARRSRDGYRLGDDVGKSGIEASREFDLRGSPGVTRIEVDSAGRPGRVLDRREPQPGRDIVLTVDRGLQQAAEQALSEGLIAAQGSSAPGESAGFRAPGGSVVALDPRDGSVLAMASAPTFDPSAFHGGISATEYAVLTDPDGALPLTNRAVGGQYAPGSTFKLVTALAGLRSGLVTPETTVIDRGAFYLGNQRFQNAQGRAYGPVDLQRSLTVSSDVYFYELGERLWSSRQRLGHPVQQVAEELGLGVVSGVDLAGEASGRLPSPDSRRLLHDQRPEVYPEGQWFAGDNVNLAIGQGDTLATPLQLANSYAAFGNGGVLYRPRLVLQAVDPVSPPAPGVGEVIRQITLPSEHRDSIEDGLAGAVARSGGTAYTAFRGFDLDAFPVAGKTGTAQVTGKQDFALFTAYAPVGSPRVAIAVVLEEAGFGGSSAAPVGRRLLAAVAGQPDQPVRLGNATD